MEWISAFLLSFVVAFSANANFTPQTDDGGMEWEEPVEEVNIPDDHLGHDVHAEDDTVIDEDEIPDNKILPKKPVDQFLAETCDKIRGKLRNFRRKKIRKATQYFTPMFTPGRNGQLQRRDRRACINIEGSCIVNTFLYNWAGRGQPWGKRYTRADVSFKFGKGSGKNYYNKTNALDPCRTVAAHRKHYPTGTVIYVPSMRGKVCPQTKKPVDGCFIVGDVGAAIKGQGRFDFFTGECADYSKRTNTCRDALNRGFIPSKGDRFYVIGRHNMLAKELREEVDLFVNSDWRTSTWPFD